MADDLRFRVLGRLRAERDGSGVDLGPPKQRALLAYLLLHPRQPIPTERLVDALWGEEPPETAASMVHLYVSRLRRALNGDGGSPLRREAGGYVLDVAPEHIDAEVFERLVAEGQLGDALRLWEGRAFEDLQAEDFAAAAARRLDELRLAAIEEQLARQVETGGHARAVADLQRLVADNPYRERLHALLMLALYRSGRQADALEAYARARRVLRDDLGLEPSAELRDLQRAILEQDATVAPAPAQREPQSGRTRRARSRLLGAAAVATAVAVAVGVAVAVRGGGDPPPVRLGANSVGRIDARTNRIVSAVPVGAEPAALAVGGGSVWVANAAGQTVQRVDPRTLQVAHAYPVGGRPTALAVAGDRVWVRTDPEGTLVEIDARFGTVADPVRLDVEPARPGGAAPGVVVGGGAVWTPEPPLAVIRLDPRTRRLSRIDLPDGATGAIGFGDGDVWVAGDQAATRLVDGAAPAAPVVVPDRFARGIAVGHGAVWIAYRNNIAVVGSRQVPLATIELTSLVGSIAVSRGAVWATLPSERAVVRIDPRRRVERARIALAASPTAIAARGDAVWVAVS